MDTPAPTSPWLLWQVIDSAFPVGSFAHSGGLEAAVQFGFVADADTLAEFVRVSLVQAATLAAPFVAAVVDTPAKFDALNRLFDTMLTNDPANRASRALGVAMLTAGDAVRPGGDLGRVRAACRRDPGYAHLPPAWGLLAATLGLDAEAAVDAFLFQQARTLFSSAVRLGVVGPMEAQRLQASLDDTRSHCLALVRRTTPETATGSAPTLDLLQSLHERLYSRLFNS